MVEVLKRANPAVLATLRSDGAPVTAAMWYLWVDGRILLSFAASRSRLAHLRRDPRASLTVFDGCNWERHISLQGTVTLASDPGLIDIDKLSLHFNGVVFEDRSGPRVTAWLEIDTIHSWGF